MKANAAIFSEKSKRIEKGLVDLSALRDQVAIAGFSKLVKFEKNEEFTSELEKYSVSVRVIGGEVGVVYRDGQKEIEDIVRYGKVDENIVDIVDILRGGYSVESSRFLSLVSFLPFHILKYDDRYFREFFEKVRSLRQSVYKIRLVSDYYYERFIRALDASEEKLSDIEKEKVGRALESLEFKVRDLDLKVDIVMECNKRIEEVKSGLAKNNRVSVVGSLVILMAVISGIADLDVAAANIKSAFDYVINNVSYAKDSNKLYIDFNIGREV